MCDQNQMTFESLLTSREFGSVKNHNFKYKINNLRLSKLSQSKLRDVKVVGHGAITSVAVDPLGKKMIFLQTWFGSSTGEFFLFFLIKNIFSLNQRIKF